MKKGSDFIPPFLLAHFALKLGGGREKQFVLHQRLGHRGGGHICILLLLSLSCSAASATQKPLKKRVFLTLD